MVSAVANRPPTQAELDLARFMLESGGAEARGFLTQLETVEVTPWRCLCGCASIKFQVRGQQPAPPGVHILGDFVFGSQEVLTGAFIFESGGLLSGIEVYGLASDAPSYLPNPSALRPLGSVAPSPAALPDQP